MESGPVKISWVIATRNRRHLLSIGLERLIAARLPDEEILVVDGNSTDGTQDYLKALYSEGKIQNLILGKDRNQAHAWNKAFLSARGTYIKKIIDDDVFDVDAIRKCVQKMEETPEADICISEDMSMSLGQPDSLSRHSRIEAYTRWVQKEVPSFTFGDVHMIIRRSSLSLIGLYDASFVMMDYEYSLRISYLRAGILFYTGCNAMSVSSPITVSSNVTRAVLDKEGVRANAMYEYAGDGSEISLWSRCKILVGRTRDKVFGKRHQNTSVRAAQLTESETINAYQHAVLKLTEENQKRPGSFLFQPMFP